MDDTEFWRLVDTLGGVADDVAVAALLDSLPDAQSEAFTGRAHDLVTALLERCRLPAGVDADLPVQVCSAVLAAGRATYDATLVAGGELDPSDWRWQEAAALLVPDVGEPDEMPALALQWLTDDVPAGVVSGYLPGGEALGDLPTWGPVGCEDAAWDAAREALLDDPRVAHARQAIGERYGVGYEDVSVWLSLREATEPDITLHPPQDDLAVVVVVGTTPAADLRDLSGDERTAAYVELVTGLLQVVLEAL